MDYQKNYNDLKDEHYFRGFSAGAGQGAGSQNSVNAASGKGTRINVRTQQSATPAATTASAGGSVPKKPSFWRENKWAIWLIGGAIAVFGLLALMVMRNINAPGSANPKVNLAISAPNQVPSGSELIYKIQINNNDNSAIKKVSLDLLYPQGFIFEDSTPKPNKLDGTHFDIANLDPGQNAVIMLKGSIIGNAGETKTLNAVLHYQFANFSSDFISQSQSGTQITASNVALQFKGPQQVSGNQSSTYQISYANIANHDLNGLKLTLNIPNNFQVLSYSPQPDLGTTWDLGDLPINGTNSISITGAFNDNNAGDQFSFVAEIDGPDTNGQSIVYSNSSYQVSIVAPQLEADLSQQNAQAQGQSASGSSGIIAKPGDTMQFKINYKNNDITAATGVILSATIDGAAADLSTVLANNAAISGNTITWNASQVSAFASLQPGQSGELDFSFRIKDPATRTDAQDMTVSLHTDMKSNEYSQPFESPETQIKIASVVGISGSAAYVSGANPVSAGQTTVYRVTISARNSTNAIDSAVLTMNLPNSGGFDITSINSAEQANVTYDNNTKKITWNLGTLKAHTGDFSPLRKLQFNVEIQPSAANSTQQMTLVNNISFSGTDSFTQQNVSQSIGDITNSQF